MISWMLRSAAAGNLLKVKVGACASGEEGGDGVLIHVEDREAVTPVARKTLDSVQIILSSSS